MIKCYPVLSEKSGEAVRNQYIIKTDETIVFQSYNSIIAALDKESGRLTLGAHFDYSRTTAKYLHQFIKRYCSGALLCAIYDAPGGSFTARLRWCIKNGIITYKEDLV